MKLKKVRLSLLVEDYDFYPRSAVDSQHSRAIEDAIRAGIQVPPIIVEDKTMRIVDGWHRHRALRSIHGDADPEIQVEIRVYANDGELLRDAGRLNATHGRALTSYDRQRFHNVSGTLWGHGRTDRYRPSDDT